MNDLSIVLDNRPGALAEMGEALGRAGVSIEGGGAWVADGRGVAHFLFEDGAAARRALEAAGIRVLEEREVLVQRLNQAVPGQLGLLTCRMAAAGVNIEVLYSDHDHHLILVVDDLEKGRAVAEAWLAEQASAPAATPVVDASAPAAESGVPGFSLVLEVPPAAPEAARAHFAAKLAVETDPSDVHLDLKKRVDAFVVLDARSPEAYAACHVPGARSLPYRRISAATTADLPRDKTLVVYCWGPACNAATKAAVRLAALGFSVKEMIGGLEYWRREGFPVEGSEGAAAPLYG